MFNIFGFKCNFRKKTKIGQILVEFSKFEKKVAVFSPTRLIICRIIFYIHMVCAPIKTTQIGEVRKKINGHKKSYT